MSGAPETLFQSPNLAIRKVASGPGNCCVVTFASFTDTLTLDRPGFGEAFFHSRRIDAIHVISRDNGWYQYAEMMAAMEAIRAVTAGYSRVITYGASMGGYAAIRLAGLAGAHCVLALSPQYSIDRKRVPFERRWQEASSRFKPVWEGQLAFPVLDEAFVVFDPNDPDGRHAALLRAEWAFTPVPLREAGHTASGFLQEVGLLQAVVLAVCDGTFDAAATIEEAWRRRARSPQHFQARAEQARRPRQRLALFADAVQRAPTHVGCLVGLAIELSRAGRYAEAAALHKRAVAIPPARPSGLHLYSIALERSGDLPAALSVMEDIERLTAGDNPYGARLDMLRERVRTGDPFGARLVQRLQRFRRRLRPLRPPLASWRAR